ncbi:MAG TPA: isoprenylcysteine carboxylmethyltransferase family protein [Candidatus Xenobia bacterium]|nr:isoprenylcysteine carboxylmethyltransferase family protein [Candidatus Xenobia bacterium]
MGVSEVAYIALLAIVGLLRLVEIRISRRNQRFLASKGVAKIPEPQFRWMVIFHTGILVSAGLEVVLLHRPFIPLLALGTGALFLLANALRFWVIRTMAWHWNVEVMASTRLGVVTGGPYRWIRHPNYVGVFVELLALPLIHTAWLTALVGSALHVLILRRRIRVEESALLADPEYRAAMGSKPRFFPRFS